jgi:hypothetical protein
MAVQQITLLETVALCAFHLISTVRELAVCCLLSGKGRDVPRLVKFGILALLDRKRNNRLNPVGINRSLRTYFHRHKLDQFRQLLVAKVTKISKKVSI